MTKEIEKRTLQVAVFILAFVPAGAGLMGVIGGAAMTGFAVADISLDSHVRYLSGLLLAIGVAFWSFIPAIETKTLQIRLLSALVFTGGLARGAGVLMYGWPSPGMVFGLGMEVVVVPLLCFWQGRVARAFNL